MAGGIINGTGLYGETALQTTPELTIIVPTVLQIAGDMLSSITNLTCLYDRYWYNRADLVTFPISFFYVKKIEEIMETEVSQKRVMLYEPQKSLTITPQDLAAPLRNGVMQVVVDNAVKKPKTYNMEIILPFMPISDQFGRTMNENLAIIQSFAEIFGADTAVLDTIGSIASAIIKAGQASAALVTQFQGASDSNFINKNSLESMWENNRMLTMKMWSGFDYKYVMITNLVINKDPKEDNVFRATMRLQEMPVLSVTPALNSVPGGIDRNWAATAVQLVEGVLLEPIIALTGVEAASGKKPSFNLSSPGT